MKTHLSPALSVRRLLPLLGLLWGPGCGTLEAEPKTGEAPAAVPLAQLAQEDQGLTAVYTLSWADNRFTGACNWDLNPPLNGYASGWLQEPVTLTGLAGRRIKSLTLSSAPNTAFKYDDVMLLNYNQHILMSSDRRVAQYSNAPSPLGTAPVPYVWSKVRGQAIDNQNLQPAWCASGATGANCTVPVTETVGTLSVNIPDFRTADEAAYPSMPDARTFTLVTIGDDEPEMDCRHGAIQLTLTAETCVPQPEVCDGKDNNCDDRVDEDLGTITCGVGACQRTVAACSNGSAGICTPGTPSPETRDNVDNDCDGWIDENYTTSVPVSTLTGLVRECTSTDLHSTVGYSRACIAAARRYCNNTGWEGGTIVEYSPPTAYLACFRSKGFMLPVSTLTGHNAGCTTANVLTTKEYSRACDSAANRYCNNNGEYATGLPQEFDGVDKIYVNCIQQPGQFTYFPYVSNNVWTAKHPTCQSNPLAGPDISKACRAAAHRWCASQGAISGVPVEWWGTTSANLACIYL